MPINETRKLKIHFYRLTFVFFWIFISGFLELGGKALLIATVLFFFLAVVLLSKVLTAQLTHKLKTYLLLTGSASILFAIGLCYGIWGIWGLYEINDAIYIGSVAIAFTGYVVGTTGALVSFKKHQDIQKTTN